MNNQQRSTYDFLTTQTIRERLGIKKLNSRNPKPMATMRVDLYAQIEKLEEQLDAIKISGVYLKITVLLLLLVNASLASVIYLGGIAQ